MHIGTENCFVCRLYGAIIPVVNAESERETRSLVKVFESRILCGLFLTSIRIFHSQRCRCSIIVRIVALWNLNYQ